jgi:putative ABC transport system permease protein
MNAADVKVVVKLVLSHMRYRPARMLLTLVSTIAAACVVVWVVSSYDSLVAKFDEFADNYLGRYELVVLPRELNPGPGSNGSFGGPASRLAAELVAAMKEDPGVAVIDPVFQTRARISKAGTGPVEPAAGSGRQTGLAGADGRSPGTEDVSARPGDGSGAGGGRGGGPNRNPTLVGTNAAEAPHRLLEGRWIDPRTLDSLEAVISSEFAGQLEIRVGDEVTVTAGERKDRSPVNLKIAGIVEQRQPLPSTPPIVGLPAMRGPPLTRGPASAALYVPTALAEKISGVFGQIDFAGVILKKGTTLVEFKQRWTDRLAQAAPPSILQSIQEVESELENSTTSDTVRAQAYSATGISLLAAVFIIFSTLSMGVDERIRQFAMLRAVTFTKAQVAAMIAMESVILGFIGWGGGLLAGWGLLEIMKRWKPDLFPVGSSLGWSCVTMSGVCSLGCALAASVVPAWKATRIKPLEGMSMRGTPPLAGIPWIATLAGLAMVAINPLLVFWVPMPDKSRYLASAVIGCTCMGIGFILLAPAAVLISERALSPILSFVLRVNPKLLATQLTTNLWRTLGATVSLTLGLGLFVAIQTWGYSMLGPYTPGDWVPDFVVVMSPTGIPDSAIDAVRHLPGIIPERSLPCVSGQLKFATDVTGANVRATSSRQDNCVLVGVDPDLGLGGPRPVFNFTFVRGQRDEALAKIKRGRYCLVPDHFERESGLSVGDKFSVLANDTTKKAVEYEIAGVVSMAGWHWMSKVGLRNGGGGRSAGLMFAAFDQVRKDFRIERVNAFWLNGDGSATEDGIKESLLKITERSFDPGLTRLGRGHTDGMDVARPGPPGRGRRAESASSSRTTVNIRSREGVRVAIRERANGIIWLLSRLPLVTLFVTSLGIVNTIVASVRARQWDLGVMRAVGVTRFGLFRLILCEAFLVGAAACILSFGFGIMAGYCGTGVTRYVNVRGGQITPLVIPWMQIGIGFSLTLSLCLIAALCPAIRTGRTEPLRLLQAGRSAM